MKQLMAHTVLVLAGLTALLPVLTMPPVMAQVESRTFPETGKTVKGRFLQYWDEHGGLPQQGFPISEEMQEKSDTDGKTYNVQYFERAAFEYHPGNQPPNDVLLSLLGIFLYGQKYPTGAPAQVANTASGSVLFPETSHHVGGKFLTYWQSHGGLAQQGYPISEEFHEVSTLNGKLYTVQYFERAVFELHPENQPPYDVLLSQLGKFRYDARYGSQAGGSPTSEPTTGELRISGQEEVVFDWSRDKCEGDENDYPDTPARAFRDVDDNVQLIASHFTTRRMVGRDLNQLAHDCTPVMRSDQDPDPAKFNDREWIHSIYTLDGKTIYALIHDEYRGNEHEGHCPPSARPEQCWYNAITLATSTDAGRSYQQSPAPSQLIATVPYVYAANTGGAQFGVFNPSNIIKKSDDGFYYVLLHLEKYDAQDYGTCVMRTNSLAEPASWRAWDGNGYNIRFINPYTEVSASPQDHVCKPVSQGAIQKLFYSVTYNTYLKRFVLVGEEKDDSGQMAGFYYSFSNDLINWTPRRLLLKAPMIWSWKPGDPGPLAYPAVLDPNSSSRNFEDTGKQAFLYYTRFNSGRDGPNRDLVRVAIEFFK